MIDSLIKFAGNNVTTWLGLVLYWLPLVVCLYGYTVRTWKGVQYDIDQRKNGDWYIPKETVGGILARFIFSIFPVANLIASIFDVGPILIHQFTRWLAKVFDFPLVPDSDAFEAHRDERKRNKRIPS